MKRRQDRWLSYQPPEEGGQEWHQGWGTLPRVCSACPGASLGTWECPAQGEGNACEALPAIPLAWVTSSPFSICPPCCRKKPRSLGAPCRGAGFCPWLLGGLFNN